MATVNILKHVHSCKRCGHKLLEITAGNPIIGSSLITCKKCKTTQFTPLRQEWYAYPSKWTVFIWPILLPLVAVLTGLFMGDLVIGIILGVLFFLIGLCVSGVHLVRMFFSKKRMRSIAYLDQLLEFDAISQADYVEFRKKAK